MNEGSRSRKKSQWEWLKRNHSHPHLSEDRGRSSAPSSVSQSRTGSRRRFHGFIRQTWDKVAKRRSTRSAERSPNPELAPATSSRRHSISTQRSQLQNPSSPATLTPEANANQDTNSGIAKAKSTDLKNVNERITAATKGVAGMSHVPGTFQNIASTSNNLQSISDASDKFSAVLGPIKVFNSIANQIAEIHPYAKVALSIFTCASKMILDQADRDVAVSDLLKKVSDVYAFITEDEALAEIPSIQALPGKIARQTLECADFIVHYSETKSVWIRLGKHILDETDAAMKSYTNVLDSLMQQFRDRAARDTVVNVHRIAEGLDLRDLGYVDGAGRDTSKLCLPGTREDILSKIADWIDSTGEDVPRVLWLSGTAGKGKSAIAHTIANRSLERGVAGALFCFDRTQEAQRRHEKIFTTIARDLSDRDPILRGALARAVRDDTELRHSKDVIRQWRELILGPVDVASKAIAAPVLIVIDALDESGEADSRKYILRLLTDELNASPRLTELPENLRVLITSRPLEDIGDTLLTASHVRHISMDSDHDISPESAEHDIQIYVSTELADLRNDFNDAHFQMLARKSDGLFEWARLACKHIKSKNTVSRGPMSRFLQLVETSAKGRNLLDDIYRRILTEIMPKSTHDEAIPIFRSVMGQVLASLEPLPMTALTMMRQHFPYDDDHYDVKLLVGKLGSLLTGIEDPQTPIRPLHASFYDFLTDKSRSDEFFVEVSSVRSDLAFASLRVMKEGLRFNICSLESSYLPNSAVPDLEKRVKESIPTELSYSCRFWGPHVQTASFELSLVKEVAAFFDGERLLFWLEALGLMKCLSGSVVSLSCIADWLRGHAEYSYIGDAVRDTQRFIRTFAAAILHSTPHLYLSALPFAPTESRIFQKFAAEFPCTPRIFAGHVVKWPTMEKIIHWRAKIYSVAISPNGKRLACGSGDGIQVWDAETGEALGAPMQHDGNPDDYNVVTSIAFSSDGTRIVSCSKKTVRIWNADTGEALCAPLQGHSQFVECVAISPDGRRIVSGSWDLTIQTWDAETGDALGAPLQGHHGTICSVAFSPDGTRIVSGSGDRTIRIWDAETGAKLGPPLEGHTSAVCSVAISPDGAHIVSGSGDTTIRMWHAETGEALGAPLQGQTEGIRSVAISSDGTRIVSGSDDRTIRIWDAETGETLGAPLQGHTGSITSVAISSDGTRIVSGSRDKTIRIWDAEPDKELGTPVNGHTGPISSVAISPDGYRIVSSSWDETIRMWDMETGKASGVPFRGHDQSFSSVAISPDGKRIVSGSFQSTDRACDKIIMVWDAETGEAVGSLDGKKVRAVDPVAVSPDGKCIVFSLDYNRSYAAGQVGTSSCEVWDMETGEVFGAPLQGHTGHIFSIAISSDGTRIVSCSADQTVRVWDMKTHDALGAPLEGHTHWVVSVAISPDGTRIVSGSYDRTVRVWDMETREALGAPLEGHTDSVQSVAISPDGKRIVSGSADRTIRVWDMETREELGAPRRGHTDSVVSVAISPDGRRIVSGSSDKTIRVWDLEFPNGHQLFNTICFSTNPTHALCSASSFLQGSPVSLTPTEGWIVGPEGRLLCWIPGNFHTPAYFPGNMLVIPNDASQFDLSHFAHGKLWHECRKQKAAPESWSSR